MGLGSASPTISMKTTILLPLVLLASLPGALRAENAREIASGFDKQKAAAIQSYLEKNPGAADKDEALAILAEALTGLGEQDAVPALLAQRYEGQPKGPDANLGLIVNGIIRPYLEASLASGQRAEAKAFLAKVKADFASHPEGPRLSQFLDQIGGELYLPGVGDEMKIAFTDLKGQEIDLAKMTDKVVLVDFWATWCGPCIAEMPNVIAAYEKYKGKGFEVVGISLDEDKAAVEKFVAEKKMPWPQHFDGKGWENEIAQSFGIKSIPATFLVGKGGKIVASNLRGEDLEKAVEKALGE